MGEKLIIGMGTGRCGTVSLYRLLNLQNNSFFTHESKPLLTWEFNEDIIDIKLKKLLNKKEKYVGDVNSCYLPYTEFICKKNPSARIVVLKRSKKDVIKSFVNHTNFFNWNHWIKHNGVKWRKAGKWDKMHPKYNAKTKEEAIGMYWEEYYMKVNNLLKKYPRNIKIFSMESLNSEESVSELLNFCGIEKQDQNIKVKIRENKSNSILRFIKYFIWKANKI